jgi:hypothetical protein
VPARSRTAPPERAPGAQSGRGHGALGPAAERPLPRRSSRSREQSGRQRQAVASRGRPLLRSQQSVRSLLHGFEPTADAGGGR